MIPAAVVKNTCIAPRDERLMHFVCHSIHEAEDHDDGSGSQRVPLPLFCRESKKCCAGHDGVEKKMPQLVDIRDCGKGKASPLLVREIKNHPHDHQEWDYAQALPFALPRFWQPRFH
jgi:hypothetical protein